MSKTPVVLKRGQKKLPKSVANALKGVLGSRNKAKRQKRNEWTETPVQDDLDIALRDTGWKDTGNQGGMSGDDGFQW